MALEIIKAVNILRPSRYLQNSRIWPTTANSCVLLWNASNLTILSINVKMTAQMYSMAMYIIPWFEQDIQAKTELKSCVMI